MASLSFLAAVRSGLARHACSMHSRGSNPPVPITWSTCYALLAKLAARSRSSDFRDDRHGPARLCADLTCEGLRINSSS